MAAPFRVVIAGLLHETNTYCSTPTRLEDFTVHRRAEIVEHHRGTANYIGGMLAGLEALGAEPRCALMAYADPSGLIAASAYDALKEELLSGIADALPADAVALSLHGAGMVEGIDDLEVDLCREVRRLVGPDVPIAVTLDLHGNLVQELGDTADLILGVQEYPHIDMADRGREAADLLPRLVAQELEPITHIERLPLLLPPTTTFGGPMAEINALCRELEARPGVLDVTVFHGFPYTDSPYTGASVVAITDRDPALARRCAVEVASTIWRRREEFIVPLLDAEQSVAEALRQPRGPVVINETSDNCGGGTPGDGTHLLRAMVDAGLENACFGFLVDPEVAAQAHRAGVGATIEVRLGGKTDSLHGAPIEASAYVTALTDGRIVLQAVMAGERIDLGRSARLRIGGIDVIVASRRFQTLDPEVFLIHGIDVRRYRIVALKSSQHFRAGFADVAAAIVTADTPGLTTSRVEVFGRARTPRPIWPLDADAVYQPGSEAITLEAAQR